MVKSTAVFHQNKLQPVIVS